MWLGPQQAQTDLDVYRTYFGLGSMTLQQLDQRGVQLQFINPSAPGYVLSDSGWAVEEMLDLEMASAMCPCCSLMYVAADSAYSSDLMAAVKTALLLGAKVVSMSFGLERFGSWISDSLDIAYLNIAPAKDIALVVASGDKGFNAGVAYPAMSRFVTAVGGTKLRLDKNGRRVYEAAWSSAGSGCSPVISKPSWQIDSGCLKRTVADVSAVGGKMVME
jgi:subtilase family serine protease